MINVCCAVIINNRNEILVTQRSTSMSLPLKWEFPGGKIDGDETAENCLLREIKEELDINVDIIDKLSPSLHKYTGFSVNLIPFICKISSGNIKLIEHINYKWMKPALILTLDLSEADIPIIIEYLSLFKKV